MTAPIIIAVAVLILLIGIVIRLRYKTHKRSAEGEELYLSWHDKDVERIAKDEIVRLINLGYVYHPNGEKTHFKHSSTGHSISLIEFRNDVNSIVRSKTHCG